jgi:hypothetical protein
MSDIGFGEIELLADARRDNRDAEAKRQAMLDAARHQVDAARIAMASLAAPAVALIAARIHGEDADWDGRKVTDERIEMALTVLDRIGLPKLRATAIAASIAHAPHSPAPGSPGWAPAVDGGDEAEELDVGSVDAQITAFLEGVIVGREEGHGG